MKILTFCLLITFLLSGCSSKVKKSEVVYDKQTQTILYSNRPYTGIIEGEDEEAYWSAEVKEGKIISEIEKRPNGFSEVRKSDGTIEYYNKSGKEITKEEFDNSSSQL